MHSPQNGILMQRRRIAFLCDANNALLQCITLQSSQSKVADISDSLHCLGWGPGEYILASVTPQNRAPMMMIRIITMVWMLMMTITPLNIVHLWSILTPSPPSLHSLFWSRDSSSLSEKYSIGIQYCYQTHDWNIKQNQSQQYPIMIYKWPIQAKVFCRLNPIVVLVCSYSIWLSGCFWLITTQVSCFLCFSPVRGCPPCGRSLMCVWLLADALLRGGRVGQHLHLSRFSVLVDQTANCPILSLAAINHSNPHQKTIFIAIIVMMVIETPLW